jgi:hypothetical protein
MENWKEHRLTVQIRPIIYVYYYLPRARVAGVNMANGNRIPKKALSEYNAALTDIVAAQVKPMAKAKAQELAKMVNAILDIIAKIPSVGIRNMLMKKLGEVLIMASTDIGAALEMAADLMTLANNCLDACRHILANISLLMNPAGVRGPAVGLLKMIAQIAKEAMNGAGTLNDLLIISDMTDRAVLIMQDLVGLDPKSTAYAKLLADLQIILGSLMSMNREPDEETDDTIDVAMGANKKINNVLDHAMKGTQNPAKLDLLDKLGKALDIFVDALKETPNPGGAQQDMDAVLRKVQNGDLEGALLDAQALAERTGRMGKLDKVLAPKLDRLQNTLKAMAGPSRKLAEEVLQKLKDKRAHATSPDDLLALDEQLMAALEAVDKLSSEGAGPRSECYRKLLAINNALGSPGSAGSPGAPGAGPGYGPSPGSGSDASPGSDSGYGPSPGSGYGPSPGSGGSPGSGSGFGLDGRVPSSTGSLASPRGTSRLSPSDAGLASANEIEGLASRASGPSQAGLLDLCAKARDLIQARPASPLVASAIAQVAARAACIPALSPGSREAEGELKACDALLGRAARVPDSPPAAVAKAHHHPAKTGPLGTALPKKKHQTDPLSSIVIPELPAAASSGSPGA